MPRKSTQSLDLLLHFQYFLSEGPWRWGPFAGCGRWPPGAKKSSFANQKIKKSKKLENQKIKQSKHQTKTNQNIKQSNKQSKNQKKKLKTSHTKNNNKSTNQKINKNNKSILCPWSYAVCSWVGIRHRAKRADRREEAAQQPRHMHALSRPAGYPYPPLGGGFAPPNPP